MKRTFIHLFALMFHGLISTTGALYSHTTLQECKDCCYVHVSSSSSVLPQIVNFRARS